MSTMNELILDNIIVMYIYYLNKFNLRVCNNSCSPLAASRFKKKKDTDNFNSSCYKIKTVHTNILTLQGWKQFSFHHLIKMDCRIKQYFHLKTQPNFW